MAYNRLKLILLASTLMAALCAARATAAAPKTAASLAPLLQPVDPAAFFIDPNKPTDLAWKALKPLPDGKLICQVTDYWGEAVALGTHPTIDADGVVHLSVQLKAGFYQVEFPGIGQFGVVALPPHLGAPDPFFGIDSVLSWLEHRPAVREAFIANLHRSGIAISRDRVAWTHINPAPNKWNWEAGDHYATLRDDYARNAVPILELFADSPPWARIDKVDTRYPFDLAQTADAWRTIAQRWQKYWGALEIWNEPEGIAGGRGLSAEQYIPVVKTVAYTFGQAGIHTPIGGGVFMDENPGDYHRCCALNGLLDHVDFVSFHTYHGPAEQQFMIARYREWLKSYGKETMPLWITESGEAWPAGTARPLQDEDTRSAAGITMKAIAARACGIARYFPFDYCYYTEGERNFGMMGIEQTPLRSMAAYVQCVAALSGQGYVGDLTVGDPAIQLAPVFGSGDHRVAVLYTGKPGPGASIRLEMRETRIEGIDGRAIERNADSSIPVPDGLIYVAAGADAVAPLLKTQTLAGRLYAASQLPPPAKPTPSPIVLQFDNRSLPALRGPAGYLVQEPAARSLHVAARAWNLSDQSQTITPHLHQPDGSGEPSDQPAESVAVPAHGSAEVNWTADVAKTLDIEEYRYLTVTGGPGADAGISPLAIPLCLEGSLEQHLARHPRTDRLTLDKLSQWDKNIGAHGHVEFSSPATGQWRMDLSFSEKTGEWVYPRLHLPKDPSLKSASGLLVRARAGAGATVRIMLFSKGHGTYWTGHPLIPADDQWHAAFIPFNRLDPLTDVNDVGRFDLSRADQISVGVENRNASNRNYLEVSDLLLVSDPPPDSSR